jgi:hypothetical protein
MLQAGQERIYSQLKGQLQGMVEELIEQTRRCGGSSICICLTDV